MPHSSGGGFHGGGFHGGSHGSYRSGSGTSSYNKSFSRIHYNGARSFYYYKNNKINYIYSNKNLDDKGAFAAIPTSYKITLTIGILLFIMTTAFLCFPKPKQPSFFVKSNRTIIEDDIDVFTAKEEKELKKVLDEFYDQTGIPVGIHTISETKMEGPIHIFAYNDYLDTYDDEGHWLIVYSRYVGDYPEFYKQRMWKFEGMQGNYTDFILTDKRTLHFNEVLYNNLEDEDNTIGEAFIDAFEDFTPYAKMAEIKDFSGQFMGILCFLYSISISIFIFFFIACTDQIKLAFSDVKFFEVSDNIKKSSCTECGHEYIENKRLKFCPYCNSEISTSFFTRNTHTLDEDE